MSDDYEKEKAIYEENYAKQTRLAKKILFYVFGGLGLLYVLLSLGLMLFGVKGDDGENVGLIFLCVGGFLVLLAFILKAVIPDKGNYERYKKNIEKYGSYNVYDMRISIEMLRSKNEELEKRIEELEKRQNRQ